MTTFLDYLIYAGAFIAAVLAVEGLWLLARSSFGEGRMMKVRLARARRSDGEGADKGKERPSALDALVERRLPRLVKLVARAHAPISATWLLLISAAVFLAVFLLLRAIGAPALLALGAGFLIGGCGPLAFVSGMADRRRRKFLDQLPQAVDLMARSLQAGHPVTNAMVVVSRQMPDPIGPEFALVIEEMTYGLDREEALDNLVRRFELTELRMFVASLEVTRETGGNLAEVFLKLAEAIRAKAQLRQKVHAISAEGRLSFWVVSALPVLVAGALMVLRPEFYLEVAPDPLFWPMISLAPILLLTGAAIIWRMVNVRI